MEESVEHEIKFAVPWDFHVATAFGEMTAHPSLAIDHVATYWDTPDIKLANGAWALRYRAGWTLKTESHHEGGLIVRTEKLFRGDPQRVPDDALRLVEERFGAVVLAPIVTMRVHRSVTKLTDSRGQLVCEIDDDRVVIEGALPNTAFREIEVEAMGLVNTGAIAVVRHVLQEAGAQPHATPKYFRALAALGYAVPTYIPLELV